MAREALISPLTMYHCDETIFDGLQVPSYNFPRSREYPDLFLTQGWTLDRQTLIDNILLETCELEVLYTQPETLKFAIGAWCRKEFPVWQSLYETLFYKYNPIWNKDGTLKETAAQTRELASNGNRQKTAQDVTTGTEAETVGDVENTARNATRSDSSVLTRTGTESGTGSETGTDSGTETGTDGKTITGTNVESNSGSDINSVSAYDQLTGWSNSTKTDSNNNTHGAENRVETGTDSRTHSTETGKNTETNTNRTENEINTGTDNETEKNDRMYNRNRTGTDNRVNTGTENETNTGTENETNNNVLERVEFGNIGVTMTQQLIQAERELVKFNLYDLIIDSFKARFCLLVY